MKDKLSIDMTELKVLVVDEHGLIRKTIAKVLQDMGIEDVVETHSPKEARKLISNLHFDLVFTEIFFKSGDGFAIIDQLRHKDHRSDSPIIVLTGQAERDDIMKAADRGATDYLLKPFQSADLEKKIEKVLVAFHSPHPNVKRLREAEKLISESRYEDVEVLLDELADKLPSNPQPRYLQALVKVRRGDHQAAITALTEGIVKFPDFLKNFKLLSDIHLSLNNTDPAIEALTNELELNPKHVLRQVRLAHLLIKKGENLRAIFHLRQALLENNKNAEALYAMGVAYAKDENIEKSIYYFKRYRRVFPQDSKPLEAIIQICHQLDNNKMAEIALRDEIKQHPDRLDAYMILAKFYLHNEQHENAIQVLQNAIARHPTQKPVYLALAKIYLAQKDEKATLSLFERYRANTSDPESFRLQAELFLKHNKFSQAIASVHRSIMIGEIDPKYLDILISASQRTKQYAKNYFLVRRKMCTAQGKKELLQSQFDEAKQLIDQRREQKRTRRNAQAS